VSLCVIYGPVASGKLTTAQAFARQTNYKLFHNHLIQDILVDLFPYEREDLRETRMLLSRNIRKDIISVILSSGTDVVMTMNYGGAGGLDLMRYLVDEATKYEQPLYIAHLVPEREELNRRVVGSSRTAYAKVNSTEVLEQLLNGEGYGYETFPDFAHLEIDNTSISADEAASWIVEHYNIPIDR
jgi:hypothetical protein